MPAATHEHDPAADRYTVRVELARQSVTVSFVRDGSEHTRTFPIQPNSRSDKAMLAAALAQTCLTLAEMEAQLQVTQEQLAEANRQLFGPSSEKQPLATEQSEPPIEESTAAKELSSASTSTAEEANILPKRRRGRLPLASHLPRTRQEHRLPHAVCPHCGGTLHPLPPEITEQLIVVPARDEVLQQVRHKAVCRCCEAFTIAPLPPSMVEGSSYGSASFLAHVACNKYQLGLPYYRQEKLFASSGVPVNRTTMANLMNACADKLVALVMLLREELLTQSIVHADETTVQVLKELNRLPQTNSFMWLYCSAAGVSHPVILFEYQETRAGEHPRTFLAGFAGYLQTDGYAGYNGIEGIARAGCMAHVRSGFVKALEAIPQEKRAQAAVAAWPLERIGELYRIEKQFAKATAEDRKQARQKFSKPVMLELKAWLEQRQPEILPKSLLGKAVTYALGQWGSLMVYLENGSLSIDNNIAERAIKDLVIGRKAWLFADRPEGADTIAVMHNLLQTAVANGLDPYRYLEHVFEIMPTLKTREELKQLLPWNVTLRLRDMSPELAA